MPGIDWSMLGLGFAGGMLGGALFFGGLALGIRLSLGRRHATTLLLTSAAVRIVLLLGIGTAVAAQGNPAIAGFAVAFVLVRFIVVTAVRVTGTSAAAYWS